MATAVFNSYFTYLCCVMQHELKRQLYAWLLLAVFVPTMVAAMLHVHDDIIGAQTECSACVNHQAHAGHLTAGSGHLHDCVLCQLMTMTFIIATTTLLHRLTSAPRLLLSALESTLPRAFYGEYDSRAPPQNK